MDGDSFESDRDSRRQGGGDQDPDIFAELEQGELRFVNQGGSRAYGSGFSMAN